MSEEFTQLRGRVNRRLAHAGDVLSIIIIDGSVVAVAYVIIRFAGHLSGSGSRVFDLARTVSESYFLAIYLIWVGFDLLEFFTEKLRRIRNGGAK
jgi:hypothetical protein